MKSNVQNDSSVKQQRAAVQVALFACSFLLFFAIFSHIFTIFGEPVGWNLQEPVTTDNISMESFDVQQQGSLVAVAGYGTVGDKSGIVTLLSYNKGETFFKPQIVAPVSGDDQSRTITPQCAVSRAGKIALIWQDWGPNDSSYRLYLAESANRGKNWDAPRMLEFGHDMELLPAVFYDDLERLHIIYHALVGEHMRIYHTYFAETALQESVMISLEQSEIRGAFFPAVATSGGTIFAVWQGKENASTLYDDLYFTRSVDYGKTWTTPLRITVNEYDDNAPSIALEGDTLYLAYINNESGNWELKFVRGLDYGLVWEEEPATVFSTNVNCLSPRLVNDGNGSLRLFWHQNTGEHNSIMSSRYTILDNVFSEPQTISEGSADSVHPKAIVADNAVRAVWKADSSLVMKSTDTYTAPPQVASSTHPSGTWSQFASAEITWTPPADDSGIAGYATIVNRERYFDPTVQNIDASSTTTRVPFLPDGVSYFHIRAIDKAGNYSRTIHYPLLVSSNPLSIPRIVSMTHNEGKPSETRDASFSWSLEEKERVKGYYYSFNPGSAKVPETFTKDQSLRLEDLQDGRYFLTVRALDKTGNPGRIATFELVVGDAAEITADDYEHMAQNIDKEQEKTPQALAGEVAQDIPQTTPPRADAAVETSDNAADEAVPPPALDVKITVNDRPAPENDVLSFTLSVSDDGKDRISGVTYLYTVFRDGRFLTRGETVSGNVTLKDLDRGEYSIQAHALYSYSLNGKAVSDRTPTSTIRVRIELFPDIPVDGFYSMISRNFISDWKVHTLFILSISFALAFSLGFFRIYFATRVFFTRLIQRMMLLFH